MCNNIGCPLPLRNLKTSCNINAIVSCHAARIFFKFRDSFYRFSFKFGVDVVIQKDRRTSMQEY